MLCRNEMYDMGGKGILFGIGFSSWITRVRGERRHKLRAKESPRGCILQSDMAGEGPRLSWLSLRVAGITEGYRGC